MQQILTSTSVSLSDRASPPSSSPPNAASFQAIWTRTLAGSGAAGIWSSPPSLHPRHPSLPSVHPSLQSKAPPTHAHPTQMHPLCDQCSLKMRETRADQPFHGLGLSRNYEKELKKCVNSPSKNLNTQLEITPL